ncbi:putative reverse transcriptase domain-containing protein [Tanacetum coccineum]
MTRSSTNELFTPVTDPEREFQSSRRHFKTLIQFLKELRTNTFIGSDHEDASEHIEKVLEIVNLFHIPNITIDQVMLRAFPMSLTEVASRWLRNEPTSSIITWDGLKTKFLNKYCPPARTAKKMEEINNFQQEPDDNLYQILNSRGAIPSKTATDTKERGFGSLPSSTEENSRDQVKSILTILKADSYPIRRIGSSQYAVSTKQNLTLIASISVMPLSTYLNLDLGELAHTGVTVKLADSTVKYPQDMPDDIKVPLILGRPFLSTACAKIDVFKRKITLRIKEERIIFKSVKPAKFKRKNGA